jgi:hypothetical protein
MKTYNVTLPNGENVSKTSSEELKTLWITYHPKNLSLLVQWAKNEK